MKNRRCIILLVLLIISVAVNFYFIREGGMASPCDDKDRYSKDEDFGVLRLTEQQASDYVRRYREEYPPDQNNGHPTGFILTKRVFDEVFSDLRANAVSLDLVTYDDNLSLVVRGFNTKKTKIQGEGSEGIYVIRTFCPIDCSNW